MRGSRSDAKAGGAERPRAGVGDGSPDERATAPAAGGRALGRPTPMPSDPARKGRRPPRARFGSPGRRLPRVSAEQQQHAALRKGERAEVAAPCRREPAASDGVRQSGGRDQPARHRRPEHRQPRGERRPRSASATRAIAAASSATRSSAARRRPRRAGRTYGIRAAATPDDDHAPSRAREPAEDGRLRARRISVDDPDRDRGAQRDRRRRERARDSPPAVSAAASSAAPGPEIASRAESLSSPRVSRTSPTHLADPDPEGSLSAPRRRARGRGSPAARRRPSGSPPSTSPRP